MGVEISGGGDIGRCCEANAKGGDVGLDGKGELLLHVSGKETSRQLPGTEGKFLVKNRCTRHWNGGCSSA